MIDFLRLLFYVWAIHECGHLALELYRYHYKVKFNPFIVPIILNILALLLLFVFLFGVDFISYFYPDILDILRNILILPAMLVALTARFASKKIKESNV